MMNNEMRNLMVQLSALEQESQFLVDSLKQLKLGSNVAEKNMNEAIRNIEALDTVSGPVARIRLETLA